MTAAEPSHWTLRLRNPPVSPSPGGRWTMAQPALGAGSMQVMEALHLQPPRGASLHRRMLFLSCHWLLVLKGSDSIGQNPPRAVFPCRRTIAIYKAFMEPCFETLQCPRCRDCTVISSRFTELEPVSHPWLGWGPRFAMGSLELGAGG